MLYNPSPFSNGANPNGYTPLEERIHAFLVNDDVNGFREALFTDYPLQGFHQTVVDKPQWLDQWVVQHAVHALDHCPNIMRLWDESPSSRKSGLFATALGHALESLDEQAKCELLRGQGAGPAQICLGKHLQNPYAWLDVSPVWVGTPESDLRQAALALGWVPLTLTGQVARHMDHPDAARWSHLVPYPQTLVLEVWERERVFEIQRRAVHSQVGPTLFKTSPSWIRPEDLALAQCIIAYSPAPLPIVLTAHPDVLPLPMGEYESIERLVQLHAELGFWEKLRVAIIHGHLPAFVAQDAIELPDLDCPTC